MKTYNIRNNEAFEADYKNDVDYNCALQMWDSCKSIISDLEAFYNGETEEETKIAELKERIEELEELETEEAEAEIAELEAEIAQLEEEAEENNIYNYFNDVLDIDFVIGSDMSYKGCEICMAWGGPGLYINTMDNCIKCRWWGTAFNVWMPPELTELVDDVFSEYYEMRRI